MTAKASDTERLQADPASFVGQEIKDFVRTNSGNRLSFIDDYMMWSEPIVRFADGADPLFDEYKTIIASTHLTPREALSNAYDAAPEDVGERLSVVSWVLPTVEQTRKSNRLVRETPSRLWSHTRWYGEKFNNEIRRHVTRFLVDLGYMAAAPMLQPYFKVSKNDDGPYSNWSERHAAYAAGQGTFSLSDGLITEAGIAHRCGSVVTNLPIPASPRLAEGPYSNCLFYSDYNCRACIIRCPAGAITEEGHDKNVCQEYLNSIGYSSEALSAGYANDTSVAGCGLCQTRVPCEFRNPMTQLKLKAGLRKADSAAT